VIVIRPLQLRNKFPNERFGSTTKDSRILATGSHLGAKREERRESIHMRAGGEMNMPQNPAKRQSCALPLYQSSYNHCYHSHQAAGTRNETYLRRSHHESQIRIAQNTKLLKCYSLPKLSSLAHLAEVSLSIEVPSSGAANCHARIRGLRNSWRIIHHKLKHTNRKES
jgi:hypothetical protein